MQNDASTRLVLLSLRTHRPYSATTFHVSLLHFEIEFDDLVSDATFETGQRSRLSLAVENAIFHSKPGSCCPSPHAARTELDPGENLKHASTAFADELLNDLRVAQITLCLAGIRRAISREVDEIHDTRILVCRALDRPSFIPPSTTSPPLFFFTTTLLLL